MNYLQFIFIIITACCNAQQINIKVVDYVTNQPLKQADLYFMHSTKYFSTNNEGKVNIDLSGIDKQDEMFVALKDYQNASISLSNIQSELTIKLEKVEEIKLSEAFLTNLRVEDILKNVIRNYNANYNVDKYYFLVDLVQDFKMDTLYYNSINLNLQLKFDKGKVKAKSSGIVKDRLVKGNAPVQLSFVTSDYFKNLYILDAIKSTYNQVLRNQYKLSELKKTVYADKEMFEIFLDNGINDRTYFLIDRKTFSVVEYQLNLNNIVQTNKNTLLERFGIISIKYRPYENSWVLKESEVSFKMNLKDVNRPDLPIDFMHKISTWNFSEKPFQFFNKTIDLDSNFHDIF